MIGPSTAVFGAGWLLTTITLVRLTLPAFTSVPENTRIPPGATGTGGQSLVMMMAGAVMIAHVELAVFVTGVLQKLVALAVDMLVVVGPVAGAR